MKISKKTIAKTSSALVATSGFAGVTAYLTTKFLVKTALNRDEPKIMEKAGNLILRSLVDEEILKRQKRN